MSSSLSFNATVEVAEKAPPCLQGKKKLKQIILQSFSSYKHRKKKLKKKKQNENEKVALKKHSNEGEYSYT